ncbi:hypothetical protein HOY80DRAFT_959727 [Tuber brumale]|nr:hypothetical protein HOY80DRAFT_959727 [Tuber brumale]
MRALVWRYHRLAASLISVSVRQHLQVPGCSFARLYLAERSLIHYTVLSTHSSYNTLETILGFGLFPSAVSPPQLGTPGRSGNLLSFAFFFFFLNETRREGCV